jgi:hypothetical protein
MMPSDPPWESVLVCTVEQFKVLSHLGRHQVFQRVSSLVNDSLDDTNKLIQSHSASQTPASQKRRGRPASRTTATQIRNTAARTASIPQAVRTRGRQYQRRRAPYARDPNHIPSPEFGPLGLINGRYNVTGARHQPGYSIILCIEQSSIWGDFDFLEHRGVFCITEIPRRSSAERFHFQWRGEIVQGSEPLYGPECVGWLEFHGDGDIKGGVSIHGDALLFHGERIDQIGTRSPQDAKSTRIEWESYVQSVAEEGESWEQRWL